MRAMNLMVGVVVAGALVSGCATQERGSARVVESASEAERGALLEKVKGLAGVWESEMDGYKGRSVFEVSSSGSVVREVMDQGGEHEMTNMYHMDGRTLVMTHYCGIGNQPRMRARVGGDGNVIRFESDGVTNLMAEHPGYMGEMTLTFIDENTVRQDWGFLKGGRVDGVTSFVLKRVR